MDAIGFTGWSGTSIKTGGNVEVILGKGEHLRGMRIQFRLRFTAFGLAWLDGVIARPKNLQRNLHDFFDNRAGAGRWRLSGSGGYPGFDVRGQADAAGRSAQMRPSGLRPSR